MSKTQEALKLALEALTHLQPTALTSFYTIGDRDKAITAIREALAEQPAQQEQGDSNCQDADGCPTEMAVLQRFWRGEPIPTEHYPVWFKPAQQQEPVALPEKMYEFVPTPEPIKWHHPECEGQCIACLIEQVVQEAYGSQGLGYLQRHLTSPPQRKPLTDAQIDLMTNHIYHRGKPVDRDYRICLFRQAEAAHGIKE